MTAAEIFAIRDRSAAWKNGQKGPWKTDPGEMMKKTVVKRAYKLWPKTDRLDNAIHYLNTEEGEGLEPIENVEPVNQPRNMNLSPARYAVIRSIAGACIQKFNEGNDWGCFEEYAALEDNDEKLAVWAIPKPHSAVRTCIKKQGELQSKQQAATDAVVIDDDTAAA